jgi:hypothetical protein
MESTPKRGICITCGFLCKRDVLNDHTSRYYEMTEEDRLLGRFFPLSEVLYPWCFQHVPIHREIQDSSGVPGRASTEERIKWKTELTTAADEVLNRDRECEWWMPYMPGVSPAEHFSEYRQRQLDNERRDWELRQEQDRREWERAQSEESAKRQAATERVGLILAAAAVLLALAQVFAAMLALTPDSLGTIWFPMFSTQFPVSSPTITPIPSVLTPSP